MNQLDDFWQRLSMLLSVRNDGYVAEVESCLADIVALNTPNEINGLLALFDDAVADEVMFSIVHTIERWDDRTYSEALIASVEKLWKVAPKWAKILHIRIMNSQSTSDVYFDRVKQADSEKQSTVRDIYVVVAREWPKLAGRVDAMLGILKHK
jgi:hypothetical protein